ncbi:MAG TPA: hypothetical protein VGO57_19400 [Verrucomicrobiae bacterium]
MKSFTAILFSLLLLLTPAASLTVLAANCPVMKKACCQKGCQMACCQLQNSDSQPASEVPPQKGSPENQVTLLIQALATWNLPSFATSSFSSANNSPLTVVPLPLYTQHCALLL